MKNEPIVDLDRTHQFGGGLLLILRFEMLANSGLLDSGFQSRADLVVVCHESAAAIQGPGKVA